MRLVCRIIAALGLLLSVVAPTEAMTIGTKHALLTAPSGPGWYVAGTGRAHSLQQLATLIGASPNANVNQLGNYRAKGREGTTTSIITATYGGIFDCKGFYTSGINISSADVTPALNTGFFAATTNATLQNCNFGGVINQTGTMLDGTLMTQHVGGVVGASTNTTWVNVGCNFAINSNGYFNYTAICSASIFTSTFTNVDCQGSITLSVTANNQVVGCLASAFSGSASGFHMHNASLFVATGFSPGQTQSCSTPPCPTTGAYLGPIAVPGYTGAGEQFNVTGLVVDKDVIITNATNNNLGSTGGLAGVLFWTTFTNSSSAATVIGGVDVGGQFGRVEAGPPSASATPAEAYNNISSGDVYCLVDNCGRAVGLNAGYVHDFYATGRVFAPNAVNCGDIGRNFSGGQADHFFGWNLISCLNSAGGSVGRNDAVTGTTATQAYTMGHVSSGTSTGASLGVCGNLAQITFFYWNTTWANQTAGCGSTSAGSSATGLTNAQLTGSLPAGFDGNWEQHPTCGYPIITAMVAIFGLPPCPTAPKATKYIAFNTAGSGNITVPVDYNQYDNRWDAWGESGAAAAASATQGGGAPGSGAYFAVLNYAPPGSTIPYIIGAGGTSTKTMFASTAIGLADFGKNASGVTNGGAATVGASAGGIIKGGCNGGIGNSYSGGGGAGTSGPLGSCGVGTGAGGTTVGSGGGAGGAGDTNSVPATAGSLTAGGTGGTGGRGGTGGTGATVSAACTAGTGSGGGGGDFANNVGLVRTSCKGSLFDLTLGAGIPIGPAGGSAGGAGESVGVTTGSAGANGAGCGAAPGGGGRPNGPAGAPSPGCLLGSYTPL